MAERKEPKRPLPGRSDASEAETFDLADEPSPAKEPVVTPFDPTEDDPPLEMTESQGPKRPQVGSPDSPLPRLWKAEPDEEPRDEKPGPKSKTVDEPVKPRKKTSSSEKGSKSTKDGKEGEPKGVLKEDTPTFDTHETRQKVRIIAGAGVTGVFLLIGFIIFKLVAPSGHSVDEPIPEDIPFPTSTASTQQLRDDEEARNLFERAREVARNKNTDLAISLLKTVQSKYPKTQAAADAKAALDRPSQNPPLPLFLDRPAVVAKAGEPPAPTPASPPKEEIVVDATKTAVASNTNATANLALPANPPEMSPTQATAPSTAQGKPARSLPKGFRARSATDTHESGWPLEIVGDRDGAPMVLVPGDTFLQGRDSADPNEGPSHKVTLGTYYIDRHEVTVRQFNLFQKESGMRSERVRALAKDPTHAALDAVDDRPVVMVSARDAKDYADWAGKFLPTEAQWEAAARTPDGRIYPWGPEPPVWNRPRAPRQIDPIMSFPTDVSPYGVFDLAGNAWEWTKDWYDPKYYQQFRHVAADNPAGPVKPRSQQLVVKGPGKDWTASKREGLKFDIRYPYLGFRCVIQVEGTGNVFEPPPAAPPPGQPAAPGGNKVVVPF